VKLEGLTVILVTLLKPLVAPVINKRLNHALSGSRILTRLLWENPDETLSTLERAQTVTPGELKVLKAVAGKKR
jgi:hypothetical protein